MSKQSAVAAYQRDVFLSEEADQWFERNKVALGPDRRDCVVDSVVAIGIKPRRVLEIGCANGWRLNRLQQMFGAQCVGIDPSAKATAQGTNDFPELRLLIGSADDLPGTAGEYDLVIFGFCFYLIDPALHFRCVAEADRVLCDGGLLVISDFLAPIPYHNVYSHREGVRSFKLEFSRYFLAHPAYNLIHRVLDHSKSDLLDPDRREGVDVLLKSMTHAFPFNPFVK